MFFACTLNIFIVYAVFWDAQTLNRILSSCDAYPGSQFSCVCDFSCCLSLQIERIQNPRLYKQYMIQKEDVKRHLTSSNAVERKLFHGTSPEDAEKICEQGFDRGFAGKNGRITLS